jgi:hypothetical protein
LKELGINVTIKYLSLVVYLRNPPKRIQYTLFYGPKLAVFFMQKRTFILTALFTVLTTLLFGQATLVFSPTTFPDGLYGSAYTNQTLTVTGGTAPYTFSLTAGGLPPGMSLSTDGILSGTPTGAGGYSFTVTAVDNSPSPGPYSGSQAYTLVVDQAVLTITANNATMPYGGAFPSLGISYSGFVNGDNVSSLTTQPSLNFSATPNSPVGSYTITPSGAADPNYSFTYVNGTLSITPVPLTITANDGSMTYGGVVPALTASYTGFVNGDNVSSLSTQATITTTATSSSPAGAYPITPSSAVDPNYTITFQPGTMTVGKAPLTVTADNKTMPLGGPLPPLTVSYAGFVNGDNASNLTTPPTATTTATATSPAGTYPITPGNGASSNYTFTYVNGTLTVAKALLTITANPAGSVYGAPLVPNGSLTVSYSGFVNGDGPGSLTVQPTVTNTAPGNAPVGAYTLTPSGAVDPNYTIQYVDGIYTISPASLIITAMDQTKPYGGPLPPLMASYNGFVNGDNPSKLTTPPTVATTATASSPAGDYPITASGAADPNYTISYVDGTLTITPVPLKIKVNDASMTYGGVVPALTATYTGFVNGDDASSLTTPPTITTTASPASPAGNYPITASGAVDPSYTITYQPGTLTVGKAPLTVTADDQFMPLGGPLPALTVTYTGFVNGDDASSLTSQPTAMTPAHANSPAGTYPIMVNGGSSPNYTFTYVNGILSVGKAILTIAANPAGSGYGGPLVPNGSLTVSYSGFVNGDGPGSMTVQPVVTNSAFAGAPAGNYTLTPSGAVNPNYIIVYVDGVYTISQASLSITATNQTMTYGGPVPALTVSYSGFVNGDNAAKLATPPMITTTATLSSPAGAYPITVSGAVDPNYIISYIDGTLLVSPAALTIKANDANMTYGGTVPSLSVSYSGFVNGDNASSLTTQPIVSTTASPASPAGSYPITALGASDPNYTIAYQGGTMTVGKAPLTVTANNQIMSLGGPLPILTIIYSGFVNGDNVSSLITQPTATTTATTASPAGAYPIVPSGGSSSNYTFIYVNGVLSVAKAFLTITANPATSVYGAPLVPNGSLTVSYSGFVNGDGPGSMTVQPIVTNSAFAGAPAGAYTLTPSGAVNPNYTILYVNGDYTISPATLNVTAANQTMIYGGAMPALTVSYSGFVNGDDAASLSTQPTATTTATSTSPAGAYPITASGGTDPNYTFVYNPGTLLIDPATLVVTAKAQTKKYGAPDPTFTYTVLGLLNGDDMNIFTGSLSRVPGENVGTYPITEGSLSAGSNYTLSYTGNNLTITIGSQQITWGQSLSVGCNNSTQLQLTATASSGLPVTYSVSDTTIATVSGDVLTLLQPGSTIVTATQAGDSNVTAAPTVTDTVFFQSASLITQHWNDVIFFDNSSDDYVQWQWYKNGDAVEGDTSAYYSESPSLNGQYYVIATNKDGQQVQSCTLTITPGAAIPGGIKVFPNPANTGASVTVISNYSNVALQGALLQVVDISGRVLQQLTNVQPSMKVTMPSGTGIYIVNLLLATGQKASTNVLVVD